MRAGGRGRFRPRQPAGAERAAVAFVAGAAPAVAGQCVDGHVNYTTADEVIDTAVAQLSGGSKLSNLRNIG
jgi:hypothetical protein